MEKLKRTYRRFAEFDNQSDYFFFVDTIFRIVDFRPPQSKRFAIQATWIVFKVLYAFQIICLVIQAVRSALRTPFDVDQFTSVFYSTFVLIITLFRGLCLAYHQSSVVELKSYINSRTVQRHDSEAFELRRGTFLRINKYMAAFVALSTFNIVVWMFSTVLPSKVLKIPYLLDHLPYAWKTLFDVTFGVVLCLQCFGVWISLTQYVPVLYTLRFELRIIVQQFERIFGQVTLRHASKDHRLNQLSTAEQTLFWIDLDRTFKTAISHHCLFIKHFQLLRKISSLNFCILLSYSAVVITGMSFMFILNPSIGRLPQQLAAFQFIFETYTCCSMFNDLENENNQILAYVYAMDWLSATNYSGGGLVLQRHRKSIWQNAMIVQQKINHGLPIRAGGMFPLTLMTFTTMMKLVYSILTCMMRVQRSVKYYEFS